MIYLDNAATTKIDPRVLYTMMPYLKDEYGNPGTSYTLGRQARNAVDTARTEIAKLIKADSPEQIIFTGSGSEANNLAIHGVCNYIKAKGKKCIITSSIEHSSILAAVKFEPITSYVVNPHGENGNVTLDDIMRLLAEKNIAYKDVGLLSIMHTNNETGVYNNVYVIGAFCKEHGILFHTDCVQGLGASPIFVNHMGCDIASFSAHKIHAPKGVGALYVKDKSILSPIINGGDAQEFGLRGGTENVASIVGFGEACRILNKTAVNDMTSVTQKRNYLWESIQKSLSEYGISDIAKVNGNPLNNLGKTFSVYFEGVDAETLMYLLGSQGVCVSAGSACTSHEQHPSHVLKALGLSDERARNSIRFSVSKMTTYDEIEEASKLIARAVKQLHGFKRVS